MKPRVHSRSNTSIALSKVNRLVDHRGTVSSKVVRRIFIVRISHYLTLDWRSSYDEICLMKLVPEPKAHLQVSLKYRQASAMRSSSSAFSNNISSEAMWTILIKFHIQHLWAGRTSIFYSNRMTTLKFPLTYDGKSESWHLLLSHCRYFDASFTEMFLV